MFNSITKLSSRLNLSFLNPAENEPAQQQPLPAPEENAVQEAALSRLAAPEAPKRDVSTSVINILSAPFYLLSSSLFQENAS